MKDEFLLVHKSILPDYFEKIIQARDIIDSGKKNISEACRDLGISRNTYYKYKDYVFSQPEYGEKRLILSFNVRDVQGVLSSIIKVLSELNGNVLTINQNMPLRSIANITIMVDRKNMEVTLDELVKKLKTINYVNHVEVISYE